jgi:hypothetical protein
MPPYPRILLNAAAPQTDAAAAVLVIPNIETPCPAVPRRGPDAGEHHKQNFSNLSYPHESAMTQNNYKSKREDGDCCKKGELRVSIYSAFPPRKSLPGTNPDTTVCARIDTPNGPLAV